MAKLLAARGYDLILVARRQDRLEALKRELPCNVEILCLDLAKKRNCYILYEKVKHEPIQILINNAGFGLCGDFAQTDLETELSMIQTNIRAVHILTKLFLRDFLQRDKGYILNVASSAAFQPGPLMACYYASKAYVLRLTQAIREELRRKHSKVYIGALCPGPFHTEFSDKAHVKLSLIHIYFGGDIITMEETVSGTGLLEVNGLIREVGDYRIYFQKPSSGDGFFHRNKMCIRDRAMP